MQSRAGAQGNWALCIAFSVEEGGVVVESLALPSLGAQGKKAPYNAFSVGECGVAVELLTLQSPAVVRVFEYL